MLCSGTKSNGDPCGAHAVRGGELCAGHAGLGIAADPGAYAAAANRKSAEVRGDRAEERKRGLLDHLASELEREAERISKTFREAGRAGDWRAYLAWIERVHGKPAERVTVDAGADPLGVASMTAEERAVLMARVLEDHPELSPLIPRTRGVHVDAQSA